MSVALLAGAASGCTAASERPAAEAEKLRAALGWPRLDLKRRYGDEYAMTRLTIDPAGMYVLLSEGDDGGGTIHAKVCSGAMSSDRVRPWFQAADALTWIAEDYDVSARMVRDNPPDGRLVNERLEVTLVKGPDQPQMPATVDAYARIRDAAGTWLDGGRSPDETCTKSKHAEH